VSGGNFNHFASHVVRKLMESGGLAANVASLRASYAERAQAMDSALRKHLSSIARWQKPGGGYFFWLELPEGADTARLEAGARAAGTGFLPGSACSTGGGLGHCLRLSFAHSTVPDIHEGIARLKRAFARDLFAPSEWLRRASKPNGPRIRAARGRPPHEHATRLSPAWRSAAHKRSAFAVALLARRLPCNSVTCLGVYTCDRLGFLGPGCLAWSVWQSS